MKLKRWIACILAAALLVSTAACGGSGGEDSSQTSGSGSENSTAEANGTAEEDGPFTAYEETLTVDFGADFDSNGNEAASLAEAGEPYDNNRWTALFEDKLNIKTNYELLAVGDQYNQQIKLLMASDELPDYFKINNWSDFQQMAEAGMLTDMTDIWEKYASPLLKTIVEKETDMIYLPITYDGRKYGVPRVFPSTNGYNHLWIRRDWLENLNLEVPKTMDDVMEIARAFTQDDPDGDGQNDTLGMRLDDSYLSNNRGIFWAYDAYPNFWITQEDGSIDQGTMQPEMKEGLKFIKTMLDEGLVNLEFATIDRETSMEDVVNGTVGMYYGAHWETPHLSVEQDPEADWIVTPLPTADGSDITIPLTLGGQDGGYAVRADCEHPEALVKMLNVYVEALFGETGDFNYYFTMEGVNPIWTYSPVSTLDPEIDVDGHRQWKEAAKTGDYENMVGSGKGFYEFNEQGLIQYDMMFGPEDSAFAFVDATYPDQVIENAYFGAATPTQIQRGNSMDEYINTTLASILTGQTDLDSGFDQMVTEWRAMGGDQVITEITEILEEYNASIEK